MSNFDHFSLSLFPTDGDVIPKSPLSVPETICQTIKKRDIVTQRTLQFIRKSSFGHMGASALLTYEDGYTRRFIMSSVIKKHL